MEPAQSRKTPASAPPGFLGWRMLFIAFVTHNCAIGLNFGVYGVLIRSIETELGTTRALAATGLSLMMLALGLLSPVVGSLMRRVPLRRLMMIGIGLDAAGYVLLSIAPNIQVFLAVCALVIGPGVALASVVPCNTLVNNWFVEGRGRALGILNMPLSVVLMPVISAAVLVNFGMTTVLLLVAALFAALLPLLMLVVQTPEEIGQRPLGAESAPAATGTAAPVAAVEPDSALRILANPAFLVLSLCVGITTAAGVMLTTHLPSLAMSKGLDLQSASLPLSAFGVAAAIGAVLYGWIADRIGGPRAMTIQVLVWSLPLAALLYSGNALAPIVLFAALCGLCSGGIVGLSGVVMNQWLGKRNFSRAMGYMYLLKVPFLFGAAPLAGHLFDRHGNYDRPLQMHLASLFVVALLLLVYRPVTLPDTVRA